MVIWYLKSENCCPGGIWALILGLWPWYLSIHQQSCSWEGGQSGQNQYSPHSNLASPRSAPELSSESNLLILVCNLSTREDAELRAGRRCDWHYIFEYDARSAHLPNCMILVACSITKSQYQLTNDILSHCYTTATLIQRKAPWWLQMKGSN